jgi:hypothetical protein
MLGRILRLLRDPESWALVGDRLPLLRLLRLRLRRHLRWRMRRLIRLGLRSDRELRRRLVQVLPGLWLMWEGRKGWCSR